MDIQQLKERFDCLGIVAEWKRLDEITKIRNEIEHYYTKANKKALESLISN